MVVVIEKCGSKLSVPMLVLGTLKFCGRWDIACGKGCNCSAVGAKRTLSCLHHPQGVSLTLQCLPAWLLTTAQVHLGYSTFSKLTPRTS